MSRTIRTILLCMAMMLGIIALVSAQSDESVVAIVIRINGSLSYRETINEDWKDASVRQGLMNGYQLKTGAGDRAIIVYGSGTRVLINENTELEVIARTPEGAMARPTMERTKLMMGEVYSRITPNTGTGYEVETPSSVASVRGTEFNSHYGNGVATFLSIENVVAVMNQLGSVQIAQYQQTRVEQGSAPDEPETLSEDEATNRVSWLNDVDPQWRLNVVPQGGDRQEIGEPFMLTVWAQNRETGSIDSNASFALTQLSAQPSSMEFSTDNMQSWTSAPLVRLVNGQANLYARGTRNGAVRIVSRAPDCEGSDTTMTITRQGARKNVELRFTDPDGRGEETIILEMEETDEE